MVAGKGWTYIRTIIEPNIDQEGNTTLSSSVSYLCLCLLRSCTTTTDSSEPCCGEVLAVEDVVSLSFGEYP